MVSFTDQGVRIGHEALERVLESPQATIVSFMRLMGQKFHSAQVDWLQAGMHYQLVASDNCDVAVRVADRDFSPQEIASHVLEYLKRIAERELDEAVTEAVISVPSCFDDLQRRAVLDAARLANLEVANLINSTTAAAIGYAAVDKKPQLLAVIDFGAGSFEVSLVDVDDGSISVLTTAGDPLLGGDDMDRRTVLYLLDECLLATGLDLSAVPASLQQFSDAARTIKHELSQRTKTAQAGLTGLVDATGSPVEFVVPEMTRRELVELCSSELASLKAPCRWALVDAGFGTDDLDCVVLTGGMARMPAVRSAMKYLFRTKPLRPAVSDVIVALGAARHAAARVGGHEPISVADVTPHTTGIKVAGARFAPVIPRNHRIPCSETRLFNTRVHGRVVFELFQGERELARDNTYLGRFELDRVPGQFPVSFHLNDSGILRVCTPGNGQGEDADVPLQLSGGLSTEDVARLSSRRTARVTPSQNVSSPTPYPLATKNGTLKFRDTGPDIDEAPSMRFSRGRKLQASSSQLRDLTTAVIPPAEGNASPAGAAFPSRPAIDVDQDSLVGSTLSDRYRVDEIIADGGMGRVYLAQHTLLKKHFAIKVLHPELAKNHDIAERFVREAQAASSIRSDHVVDISDFGQLDDGTGYFVMEYLQGRTLETMLDVEGPLPATFARSVAIQIADGLRGAHHQQIVHRDLKPANVILIERDDNPHFCKILDFGIAKMPTSDTGGQTMITRVGTMMGTPHYMAPEQIDGETDLRSDIYALGILMYEMVTGMPPFDAESVAEVLAMHKWADPPAIHDTFEDADCPKALEAIIVRCLVKDPDKRYQTAPEVAKELAAL